MQPRTFSRKRDPRVKRRDETHAQWQARMDAMSDFERETGEPIITPEAEAHGEFDDVFVPDEGGHLTKTKRRRSASSMARMHENGQITADQHAAAMEIALVAELIERSVSVRGASLEARVDSSGSGRDVLVERLAIVRLERAYSDWRRFLPMPRRMVIDMVLADRDLFATARVFRVSWPTARKRLIAALDRWIDIRERTWRNVDERDVLQRYAMIGCGVLL